MSRKIACPYSDGVGIVPGSLDSPGNEHSNGWPPPFPAIPFIIVGGSLGVRCQQKKVDLPRLRVLVNAMLMGLGVLLLM